MKAPFISIVAIFAIFLLTAQSGAAPATQPSQTPVKVYVAPFSESGSLIRPGWLSSRFTDAVNNDLNQIQKVKRVSAATPLAITSTTTIGQILSHARQAGAEVAVIGIVHAAGDQLSVSGDIYDVSSGSSFGNFKASGTTQDLFAIQDSITRQIDAMVARLAQPASEAASSLANAGSNYQGSALQESVNTYDFRGLHLSNADSTHYDQQPYHVVEQPDINFLAPYYGGYGYNYCGWPGYGFTGLNWPSPYYCSPLNPGWGYWPLSSPSLIIVNPSRHFHSGRHHDRGTAMYQTMPPTRQIPPEIATRNQNISHVATPPANTIQQSPSYQIQYGPNTIQQSPSYQIRYGPNTIQQPPSNQIQPVQR